MAVNTNYDVIEVAVQSSKYNYSFPWQVRDATDVVVRYGYPDEAKVTLAHSYFQIQNNNMVVINQAYLNANMVGATLYIERYTPRVQDLVLHPKAAINPTTLEKALDKLEYQIQELEKSASSQDLIDEIRNQLDSLEETMIAAQQVINQQITNEINLRIQGDKNLQTLITNETTARGNADTALGNRITAEVNARIAGDTNLNNQITIVNNALDDLESRLDSFDSLGHYVGTFDTYADIPKTPTAFPFGVGVNDFVNVRVDETHGGAATRWVAAAVSATTIGWVYDISFSTDMTGKADKVDPSAAGNIATFDNTGNLLDSGEPLGILMQKVPQPLTGNTLAQIDASGNVVDSGINYDYFAARQPSGVIDNLLVLGANGEYRDSGIPYDNIQLRTDPGQPDPTKLPLAGGTMFGVINMGDNKITELATPTEPKDAATKEYVDLFGGGGTPGTLEHDKLSNRELPDQHPIDAITGLRDELNTITEGVDPLFKKVDNIVFLRRNPTGNGSGIGGGGSIDPTTIQHGQLLGRSDNDQHTMNAITGLEDRFLDLEDLISLAAASNDTAITNVVNNQKLVDQAQDVLINATRFIRIIGVTLTRIIRGTTEVPITAVPDIQSEMIVPRYGMTMFADPSGTIGAFISMKDEATLIIRSISTSFMGADVPENLGNVNTHADLPTTVAGATSMWGRTPDIDDYANVLADETVEGSPLVRWYITNIDGDGLITWGNPLVLNTGNYQEQTTSDMSGKILVGGSSAGTYGTALSMDTVPTINSGNPITSGGVASILGKYLPLTGGTLTGDLTINTGPMNLIKLGTKGARVGYDDSNTSGLLTGGTSGILFQYASDPNTVVNLGQWSPTRLTSYADMTLSRAGATHVGHIDFGSGSTYMHVNSTTGQFQFFGAKFFSLGTHEITGLDGGVLAFPKSVSIAGNLLLPGAASSIFLGGTDGTGNTIDSQLSNFRFLAKVGQGFLFYTRIAIGQPVEAARIDPDGTFKTKTQPAGTNNTSIATTAFVTSSLSQYLPLTGGTLTGPVRINHGGISQLRLTDSEYATVGFYKGGGYAFLTGEQTGVWLQGIDSAGTVVAMASFNPTTKRSNINTDLVVSGSITLPTRPAGTNDTTAATTAFVQTALAGKADLASPALTGTPTAPTAAATLSNTQIATTANVEAKLTRRITYGTTELTSGTSDLAEGVIYMQYE